VDALSSIQDVDLMTPGTLPNRTSNVGIPDAGLPTTDLATTDPSYQLATGSAWENRFRGRSPRILHLLLTPFRGGAEEHALSLLTALRNYGFTPFVAAPGPLLETMAAQLAESRVGRLTIDTPSRPFHRTRLVAQLAAMIQKEHIDVVHCHSVLGSLFAIPAVRIFRGRSIVETCHGREFWRQGKRFKGNFWLDRQASRFVGRFIAVSQAAAEFLQKSKGIPGNKIVTIRNGRDLASVMPPTPKEMAEARAELGLSNEQVVLLLGRLASEKGHALLLEALRALGPRRPSLIAMFAGVGPLEADLKAKCEAAGLTGRVRFLGYRQDLQRLLAASDLVVLPSISEGLPLAAVEALAAARPIVATEVGGTPEVVLNDQTGLLVPPNDSAALAQAIHRVLSNPPLARRLGTSGRRFVERHFDVRLQIDRTMGLYAEMIGKAAMPSAEMPAG
jgi:glycosyltransferase involved in cell wall biosynthesis